MDRHTVVPKVKNFHGPNTKRWLKYHHQYASVATYVPNFVLDRSKPAIGPFCTDVDGNVFLDFVSHVGVSALGYNEPHLIAVQKALAGVDPDRYAGADFVGGFGPDPESSPVPTPSHLHHKLMEWTKQFDFDCGFFSNSGAEAVENAIKICYDTRRNNGYGICFDGAFHGRTLGALSLNRSKSVQRKWYPQIAKTVSLPFGSPENLDRCFFKAKNGTKMSHLRSMLHPSFGTMDPEEVSYLIIEPMQGEGGYNIPTQEFMDEIEEVCRTYDIPLIVDEIQSGLGRTGKKWACEHFGMKPDVLTSSKGLRIGATLGRRELFPKEDGRISSTWAEGNAIASAMGYTVLEQIEKQNLVRNADRMGRYLRSRLDELPDRLFSRVRGLGLMDAVDLPDKKTKDMLIDECMKRGLLLIGCGYKSIRFLPPLNVSTEEIDMCVDILGSAAKTLR